ncbi:hypothetical protein EII34_12465 [Arachnia propionica]|uniref:Maltokinase N-terminal cap domain-containing protein n=1 Tax=Arachnia propionica TaxID=1750 RepID=A0A3P1T3R6_9ACTN|nr:hypothetical protein [Arachnia propionica]MDO5083314.1 hypothetical protein [Arachnia propionica]RRD03805.1 hypothetical protein EII34_12465 [Arachnia propionica]
MSGIAIVHPEATLRPSKLELLAPWLPDQWWFDGDAGDLELVAKFRFVDPDGEVGLDGMLIRSSDAVYHVPVTWRAHPLDGGACIGTLDHSVLGTRYCYDAQTDPVYLKELARVITEKDTQAEMRPEGSDEAIPGTIQVFGSGLVEGETSGYPHVIHKLLREPINDVVGQLMGQWSLGGLKRCDLLAVLH